jgi:glycosyltransferase involved in cell wall biosynthesis
MDEKIELSVIVPVYNVEPYLERCLDSILNQTYRVGEIICVDDGSTDGCLEILQTYAAKDARIKVIHKENGGLVSARKAGLRASHGMYIAYVDSDDWIECDMYEKLMDEMRRNRADIVTSGRIRDYQTASVIEGEELSPGIYEGEKLRTELLANIWDIEHFFKIMIAQPLWGKIFTRELLFPEQLRVDDMISVGEDTACYFPCLMKAKKVVVTGKNLYHYCVRKGSISKSAVSSEGEWDAIKRLFDSVDQTFKDMEGIIPNMHEQLILYKIDCILTKKADKVLYYKDGLLFPYGRVAQGERIVIYGAGNFGTQLHEWFPAHVNCELVAWVDKNGTDDGSVLRPEVLRSLAFDKVLLAILNYSAAIQAKEQLMALGVDESKIYMLDAKLMLEQEREGDGIWQEQ